MSSINWLSRKPPTDTSLVKKLEHSLGVSFPKKYVEIVSKFPMGHPDKMCFDMPGRQEAVFSRLLEIPLDNNGGIYSDYNFISRNLESSRIIPFAEDPFGNFICFDYHDTNSNPSVVFWDHEADSDAGEESLKFVANSFDEFLDMLYEPDD